MKRVNATSDLNRLLLFLISGSLLWGCGKTASLSGTPASAGFSLNKVIDRQVALLERRHAAVAKETLLSQVADRYRADSVDWAEELEPFRQADVSGLMNSYFADTVSATTVSLRLKKGEKLPVQFLEIIRDSLHNTFKIKATIQADNYLFDSERTLMLESRNGLLTRYELEGFQKIFYRDPEPYAIRGQVIWS